MSVRQRAMGDILRERFHLKESIVTICARDGEHIDAARESIARQRSYLEDFIGNDPFFMLTLEPYEPSEKDPPDIVRQMIETSAIIGVGPMACVAGAIAGFAVQAMIDAGATYAIVDNGGDICILNDEPVVVGIYAGSSPFRDIALEIPARSSPLGICTSSGTVGPSISFGCADAATVISEDVALADAAATALGNAVQANGSLMECFDAVDRPGIDGALLIRGEDMALWGSLPPLLRAHVSEERITRA
jgi:hypothetical protein